MIFGSSDLPVSYSTASSSSVSVSESPTPEPTPVGLGGDVSFAFLTASSACIGGFGPSGPSAGPSGSLCRHTKTHRSPPPHVTSHLSDALNEHEVTLAEWPKYTRSAETPTLAGYRARRTHPKSSAVARTRSPSSQSPRLHRATALRSPGWDSGFHAPWLAHPYGSVHVAQSHARISGEALGTWSHCGAV